MPSEFKISEKWDVCLERTVINFGMGVVAAGLAGVVLTRECIDVLSRSSALVRLLSWPNDCLKQDMEEIKYGYY